MFKVLKIFILSLIFIAGFIGFIKFEQLQQSDMVKSAIGNLDIRLKGIVDSIEDPKSGLRAYNGFGIIHLKILETNVTSYTPPPKQQYFYCSIKNGIAEIYGQIFPISKGDTFIIDTKNRSMIWKSSKENIVQFGAIIISSDEGYYDYIKKHTQL